MSVSVSLFYLADEEEEEKIGKKSPKEKPSSSEKKDPVKYVSESGEGCARWSMPL